jgi:hypothetical protein
MAALLGVEPLLLLRLVIVSTHSQLSWGQLLTSKTYCTSLLLGGAAKNVIWRVQEGSSLVGWPVGWLAGCHHPYRSTSTLIILLFTLTCVIGLGEEWLVAEYKGLVAERTLTAQIKVPQPKPSGSCVNKAGCGIWKCVAQ